MYNGNTIRRRKKGTEEKFKAMETEFSKLMVDIKSQMQEL